MSERFGLFKEYRDVRGGRESDGSRGVTRARAGSLHSPSPPPPNPGQEGTLASVVEGWQLLEGFNLRRNDQIYALTFYYFFSPKFCHFASSGNQSREEVLRRHVLPRPLFSDLRRGLAVHKTLCTCHLILPSSSLGEPVEKQISSLKLAGTPDCQTPPSLCPNDVHRIPSSFNFRPLPLVNLTSIAALIRLCCM